MAGTRRHPPRDGSARCRRAPRFAPVLVALLLAAACGGREPPAGAERALDVGDPLPTLALRDQHGAERRVEDDDRVLLFSRDMGGNDVAELALAGTGADGAWMQQRGVVYAADIHRMPGLVTRLFALPALRRRPYPMLLDRAGDATARLPGREEHVTWIGLRDRRVEAVRFYAGAGALEDALRALPAAAPGRE